MLNATHISSEMLWIQTDYRNTKFNSTDSTSMCTRLIIHLSYMSKSDFMAKLGISQYDWFSLLATDTRGSCTDLVIVQVNILSTCIMTNNHIFGYSWHNTHSPGLDVKSSISAIRPSTSEHNICESDEESEIRNDTYSALIPMVVLQWCYRWMSLWDTWTSIMTTWCVSL